MISIIIPMFNAETTIEECVLSIENQVCQNFEIIIVNDGSTDKSIKIIQSLMNIFDNIVLINSENKGVSSARNLGIENAQGEYIQFVDADDRVDEYYSQKLLDTLIQTGADLSVCGYVEVDEHQKKEVSHRSCAFNDGDTVYIELLKSNRLLNSPCNKLYKTKLVRNRFRENLSIGEDLIFNIEYMNVCSKISIVSDCLYYYIYRNSSLSTSYSLKKVQEMIEVDKFFCENGLSMIYYDIFVSNCYDCFCLISKDMSLKRMQRKKELSDLISKLTTYERFNRSISCSDRKHDFFALLVSKNYVNLLYLISSIIRVRYIILNH